MRRTFVPLWMAAAKQPRVSAFVFLYTIEALCRVLPMSVVPLIANRVLGGAKEVSVAYFFVGAVALAACLLVPFAMRHLRRHGVITLGVVLYVVAAVCFCLPYTEALIAGLVCQMVAAACVEIAMSLFVMDHVPRQELGAFEPKRLLMVGATFIIGPWAGIELANGLDQSAPFILMGTFAAVFLVVFWFLRLTENPSVTQAFKQPPNPLTFLPKFFKQPRLRLAWGLALARSGWWIMFFVYTPIFVTDLGFSERVAGMSVALGTAAMLLMPMWGRIAKRKGTRVLLMSGYGIAGILSIAVTAASYSRDIAPIWLPVAILILAGIAATVIDGAGNVLFLRAVHPLERSEMTAVFTTYRQTAQLVVPGTLAAILSVLPLAAVFGVGGLGFLAMSWLTTFIPKRM